MPSSFLASRGVRSLASVVHGALLLPLGVCMMFLQRALREQLSELVRLIPGIVAKQVFAEGAALALSGAFAFALGLSQLHTGMTSTTAVEALVAAETALALLLAALGAFRGEALFFALAAEATLFAAWGLVELYQQQRAVAAEQPPSGTAESAAATAAATPAVSKAAKASKGL